VEFNFAILFLGFLERQGFLVKKDNDNERLLFLVPKFTKKWQKMAINKDNDDKTKDLDYQT